MVKRLDGFAERQEVLIQGLKRLDDLAQVVGLDAKRLARDLQIRQGDIRTLFARHVPLARQMLRNLLNGHYRL